MPKSSRPFPHSDPTRTAFEITKREAAERAAKTAKLHALRLRRDAAVSAEDKESFVRRGPIKQTRQ